MRTAEYSGNVLANICDAELLGRTVSEGKLQMRISEDFYLGEMVGATEALELIRSCSIVNLVGQKSVSLAVDNKIGSRQAVREIEGVPFLMVYKFMR